MPFCLKGAVATALSARGWVCVGAAFGLLGCRTPPVSPVSNPQASISRPVAPTPVTVEAPLIRVESAAVAARFPDPVVTYRIPGLKEDRTAYTTQAELQALMKKWAQPVTSEGKDRTGPNATLLYLGESQKGVPIEALLFTRVQGPKPSSVLRSGRPTVLLIGQQHGDEPASAEALLVLAQELTGSGSMVGLLDRINVVVVPRANPDGAALQQAMSANGIDINRDHLLLRTPEARALAKVINDYQPVVVIDSHEYAIQPRFVEKFGGAQRFDALLQYATAMNEPEFITRAAEEWFRRPMLASLKPLGLTGEWHHTTSSVPDDKKISMGGAQPDTARNVIGLRNTVSLAIESRGVGLGRQHLKRRVQTQVALMGSALNSAADRAADLVKLRQYVDNLVKSQACQGKVVIDAELTPSEYTLRMIDPASGIDKPVVVNWDSALVLTETQTSARPCGYWLAADQTDAVARLRGLGVKVERLTEASTLQVEGHAAGGAADKSAASQTLEAPIDSFYIPLSQPLAHLVVAALEAKAPNGQVATGVVTGADQWARITAWPKGKRAPSP